MRAALAALVVALVAAGSSAAAPPTLADRHACPGAAGFTCSTLAVPLDRTGKVPGTLELNVAAADNTAAKRGVLLFLTGGPGQPGVPAIQRIAQRLSGVLQDYRLVMFDQRGTGGTAIRCPQLQNEVGTSDIAVPSAAAVRACAASLGRTRGLYSTADTVADMDLLRRALGAKTWTVDGVSYGTFVGARYAIAHPKAMRALVLDSVLPHVDPQRDDALYVTGLHAQARVLRAACKDTACGFDPAADLAWVVRHGTNGVRLFDAIVTYEFVDPEYGRVLSALHAARQGSRTELDSFLADMAQAGQAPAELFSSGLHAATLCADLRFPWTSTSPTKGRGALLAARAARIPANSFFPYTRAIAKSQGLAATCLVWPPTAPAPSPPDGTKLPAVPTLLLNGDHDLSTPLEWAKEELRLAPRGKLVVVPGASHSIQSREAGDAGRRALAAFLLGPSTR